MEGIRSGAVSAHHNYLIGGMLRPGFLVGNPDSAKEFYLLADFLLPGENTPRISGRFFDERGDLLLEITWNRLTLNPANCLHRPTPYGFHLGRSSGEIILETTTSRFPNGYITSFGGRLYDEKGVLRLDQQGSSARLVGNDSIMLTAPYQGLFSREKENA